MTLILASQSPRRKELLGLFHIPFTVRVADIDEAMDLGKPPFDEVARVSRLKALAVEAEEDDVVIAADTIVVCDGKILGKPRDEADAKRMLEHTGCDGLMLARGAMGNPFLFSEIGGDIKISPPKFICFYSSFLIIKGLVYILQWKSP